MPFFRAVADALGPHGALAGSVHAYAPREGQITMALAVAKTIEHGGVLVVEAGTGVGKTYAYLLPALLSGTRLLISTATKTLQDQLFVRDIPHVAKALGVPVRAAMLKGRSSYLCLQRQSVARDDIKAMHPSAQLDLSTIERWAQHTRSGDMTEVVQLDERSPVLPLVTSTRDNCLGMPCPRWAECHVNQARRDAMLADIVVVNHHLFFADQNIRESGVAELLPRMQGVVFDEAHQLNEIGVQFLTRDLATTRLERFAQDLAAPAVASIGGIGVLMGLAQDVLRSVKHLISLFSGESVGTRLPWNDESPAALDLGVWELATTDLHGALEQTERVLRVGVDLAPRVNGLHQRCLQLLADLAEFRGVSRSACVRWTEKTRGIRWVQTPLDIATRMQANMAAADPSSNGRYWVFTSASLGHDASMAEFVQACGLDGAQLLQVPSPFDYIQNACLYVPLHFPKPADSSHSTAVATLVALGAGILGGRTLVLTTTLRAMRTIALALRENLENSPELEVLLQGEASKQELLERLRHGTTGVGCILVASISFWEGVDVPGDALQMVVIDKLPFAPPGDPVLEAKARELQTLGKNPFMHLHVPNAAMVLKQGAGRLIRRTTDRGILVVCDVRLKQTGYGRRIQAALPSMRAISNEAEFIQELNSLTRPSTMAPL